MSSPPASSLDADLRRRLTQKHSPLLEQQAREYISGVTGVPIDPVAPLSDVLRDGVLLCRLLTALDSANTSIRINKSLMPFKQMENINTFLRGAATIGVPSNDLFQTIDLFEAKNMNQVVTTIHAFSRHAARFSPAFGERYPGLGPKLASGNVREFSAEQLNAGKFIVNTAQYGYTGGANASGIYFGKRRDIGGKYDAARDKTSSRSASVSPNPEPSARAPSTSPSLFATRKPPPPTPLRATKISSAATPPETASQTEGGDGGVTIADLWQRSH